MVHGIDKLKRVLKGHTSSSSNDSTASHRRSVSDSSARNGRPSGDHTGTVHVLPAQVNPTDSLDAQALLQTKRKSVSYDPRASTDSYGGSRHRQRASIVEDMPRLDNLTLNDPNGGRLPRHSIAEAEALADSPSASLASRSHPQTSNEVSNHVPARHSSIARKPVGDASQADSSTTRNTNAVPTASSDQAIGASPPQIPPLERLEHLSVDRAGIAEAPDTEKTAETNESVDVTLNKSYAPAVTHERIDKHIHEQRHEEIHREIHTHDVYHRILPIVDVQVLPTRHFVPSENGTLAEVSRDQLAALGIQDQGWTIAKTPVASGHTLDGPRKFTAKEFHGDDGKHVSYTDANGVQRKRTTWVHPPELERTHRPPGPYEEISFP